MVSCSIHVSMELEQLIWNVFRKINLIILLGPSLNILHKFNMI